MTAEQEYTDQTAEPLTAGPIRLLSANLPVWCLCSSLHYSLLCYHCSKITVPSHYLLVLSSLMLKICFSKQLDGTSLKAGTHYRILGRILSRFPPYDQSQQRPDYLMFAKDIVSDFPVVWGVLRVNLSGQIRSEGVGRRDRK